jgi:hypothetical protein
LRRIGRLVPLWVALTCFPAPTGAADERKDASDASGRESPWVLLPTVSSNPKLGTSVGAIAAYLHYFDEQSRPSMFGVGGQYTSTDSVVAAAFAKMSFGADHHRVVALAAGGVIKNDYDDYLGTGVPLKTEDDLRALVGRYLYRVKGNWFVGAQGVYTNYHILGQSAFDDQVLGILGMQGFESGGVGAVAYHDDRDNENSPTRGWVLNANNLAYREALGGTSDFDVYRADLKGFREHGDGNVLAARLNNQWTVDAPPSAYAPVQLRGYKMGQYLGKNMSSIELEERLRIATRWTATFFAGVACLYGDGKSCSDSENVYPSVGAGLQFVLKTKEGIVANLEFAKGKSDNYGIYLKLGYGF